MKTQTHTDFMGKENAHTHTQTLIHQWNIRAFQKEVVEWGGSKKPSCCTTGTPLCQNRNSRLSEQELQSLRRTLLSLVCLSFFLCTRCQVVMSVNTQSVNARCVTRRHFNPSTSQRSCHLRITDKGG